MKISIVGCTHAGTAVAVNCVKLYPNAEITVYERNDNISFLSCGIALYVGGIVKDPAGLFYSSPEKLAELGVKVKMCHDVTSIDTENKSLTVTDLSNGQVSTAEYDKLIMTTGSWPITPKIDGIELENILLAKNFYHSNDIIEKAKTAQNITVVGAGYIGVELVEAFREQGKQVTLIDSEKRILSKYLDADFTELAEEQLIENGIVFALNQTVQKFEGDDGKVTKVITDKGEYPSDLVILCVGFRPNTGLLKDKVNMLPNGAIIIDSYMRSSNPDIFAAGDSCAVYFNPTGTYEYIPLATNAIRMGTLAAKNLVTPTIQYMGTQSTSGIKIYDLNIAATGLTEECAKGKGLNVAISDIEDSYRPEFMPTYEKAKLRVVYDVETRVILGSQICSTVDLTQMINTMSVVIQNKMTIDQLAFVDFFFQPHYNKPWSILNAAGLAAL
jgi:NADPH-dependent 2,4-dienoyl-CoA reductase/sulfur reductase-like enzyme